MPFESTVFEDLGNPVRIPAPVALFLRCPRAGMDERLGGSNRKNIYMRGRDIREAHKNNVIFSRGFSIRFQIQKKIREMINARIEITLTNRK